MIRLLYRILAGLHPPAFRRRYSAEMLWIFDASTASGKGTGRLFRDVVLSLLRQWFLRSRLWLVPVALAGALFTVLAGNALLHFLFRHVLVGRTGTPQELFVFATGLALLTVALVLIAAVLPVLRARRRRA